MSMTAMATHCVALVGDSDIERWPRDLWPSSESFSIRCSGQSGATLEETLPLLRVELEKPMPSSSSLTVVFCAGENDISQSIRLDDTLRSFRTFLDLLFLSSSSSSQRRHLIVLGPKFEPWLEYDNACRKQYFKLSNAMERACKKHNDQDKITFVDCLTMFCGESALQPGAVLAGKAIPEKKYFDHDLLHLSREGYQIWKGVTEKHIK